MERAGIGPLLDVFFLAKEEARGPCPTVAVDSAASCHVLDVWVWRCLVLCCFLPDGGGGGAQNHTEGMDGYGFCARNTPPPTAAKQARRVKERSFALTRPAVVRAVLLAEGVPLVGICFRLACYVPVQVEFRVV